VEPVRDKLYDKIASEQKEDGNWTATSDDLRHGLQPDHAATRQGVLPIYQR